MEHPGGGGEDGVPAAPAKRGQVMASCRIEIKLEPRGSESRVY